MIDREPLEELFSRHNFTDFRWIRSEQIVVAQWVRFKCMFGCPTYGECAVCPPHTPGIQECKEFFSSYREIVVFHFDMKVDNPEDRKPLCREINKRLFEVEREVFLLGHRKSFLLPTDSCKICSECSDSRAKCKNKKQARPSPEALGMDVYQTVRSIGFPIEVVQDFKDTMNRYAFLMID